MCKYFYIFSFFRLECLGCVTVATKAHIDSTDQSTINSDYQPIMDQPIMD